MTTFVIVSIIVAWVVLSSAIGVTVCMLSSQITRMEDREPVNISQESPALKLDVKVAQQKHATVQ